MTISRSEARPLLALAFAVLAAAGGCEEEGANPGAISVPSGRPLELIDVVTNAPGPDGATARFRFLVPGLTEDDLEGSAADMQSLCDSYALPRIDGMVPAPQQIIISFAAEALPFGEAAPEIVQFFEAYRVENSACIWVAF